MKKFRSFEILITQTTEEEILSVFTDKMALFDKKSQYYIDRIEKLLEEIKEYNHYLDLDFYEPLERINLYRWMDDDYFGFLKDYLTLSKDMELCENVLWCNEEDQEVRDSLFEWMGCIQTFLSNTQFFKHELTYIDNKNYEEVAELRRQRKLEREAKQNLISLHMKHKEAEYYSDHVEDENYYLKFDGSRVYFDKECKNCLSDKAFYFKVRFEEDKEMFEYQQDQLRKEELKTKTQEPVINLEDIVCECCNYKTKSSHDFKRHTESKEHRSAHKLKNWTCSACGKQARSELEWSYHIKTKKHKVNVGEEDGRPSEYYCEACDYTCVLKTHWAQHLLSKKHQSKK